MKGMGQRHSVSWWRNAFGCFAYPHALLHAAFVCQFKVCLVATAGDCWHVWHVSNTETFFPTSKSILDFTIMLVCWTMFVGYGLVFTCVFSWFKFGEVGPVDYLVADTMKQTTVELPDELLLPGFSAACWQMLNDCILLFTPCLPVCMARPWARLEHFVLILSACVDLIVCVLIHVAVHPFLTCAPQDLNSIDPAPPTQAESSSGLSSSVCSVVFTRISINAVWRILKSIENNWSEAFTDTPFSWKPKHLHLEYFHNLL